jgi:DNA-binding NtrC family response regulator
MARCETNVRKAWKEPNEEQAFWVDLVSASIAQYFKYQDEGAYREAIRKLSRLDLDAEDRREIEVFRRSGFKHVLWGKSAAMRDLRETIGKCARLDEPVLITGESGVGKEYVARLIHERSERAMGPFVPVNCALFAGSAALANSILFGHVKGAFTGAIKDRDGAFVSASGGILFLDELADLPAEIQAKFLKVLEDGWVTPEGSDNPRKVNVRVLAATNRALPSLIRGGKFRADLYHRLDMLQIQVPPLREHIEDVEDIVGRLLPSLSEGRETKDLTPEDIRHLRSYDWPGNVRQLIKVLKRSVYLELPLSDVIDRERELGALVVVEGDDAGQHGLWPVVAKDIRPMREVRREYATRALELHAGNYTVTARVLGIAVNTLKAYLARG